MKVALVDQLWVFAIRDISANEFLSISYCLGKDDLSAFLDGHRCKCGAKKCVFGSQGDVGGG